MKNFEEEIQFSFRVGEFTVQVLDVIYIKLYIYILDSYLDGINVRIIKSILF